MNNLAQKLKQLETRRSAHKLDQTQTLESSPTIPVEHSAKEKTGKQLAFWPQDAAALPTELTRVSLFGMPSDTPGRRKLLNDQKLDTRCDIANVEVLYTGMQLCARDETAWLACLRIGRGYPMGQRIYLKKADLLRECGLANNGQNWKAIAKRLDRLSKAHFTLNCKRGNNTFHATTGMLKWGVEEESGTLYIRLDPDGAALFERLAYQPWDVRLSLKSDISARMLTYISGHEQGKPHSVVLNDLKCWCGYSGRLDKFKNACETAMTELEKKGVLEKNSSKILNSSKGKVAYWVRAKISQLSISNTKS